MNFRHQIKTYFSSLPLIVLIITILFPIFWTIAPENLSLNNSDFQIKAKFNLQAEETLLSKILVKNFHIEAIFEAKGKPYHEGLILNIRAKKFRIFDHKNRLVLAFENQNGAHRYQSYVKERDAIYKAFHIDPLKENLIDDESLFCESFDLYYEKNAQISKLRLPKKLQKAIHYAISDLKIRNEIEQFIKYPKKIPPLLSRPLKKKWKSESDESDLIFQHHSKKKSAEIYAIDSHIDKPFKEPYQSHFKLKWLYHKAKARIDKMELDFSCSLEKQLFGQKTNLCYEGNGQLLFFDSVDMSFYTE